MQPLTDNATVAMIEFFDVNSTVPTHVVPPVGGGDLLTMSQYYDAMKVSTVLAVVICTGGIVGNILNIRTFLRIGLEDSMTIFFFNLAIADLGVVSVAFAALIPSLLFILQIEIGAFFAVQPNDLSIIFLTFSTIFGFANKLLTTFLALQRTLCVAIPLHFKGVFTRYRTFVIIGVIWAYSFICQVLLLFQYSFLKIPGTNGTRTHYVMVRFPPDVYFWMLKAVIIIFDGIIVYLSCLVSVFVCVVTVNHVLVKSVRFRNENVKPKSTGDEKGHETSKQTSKTDKTVETKDNLSGAKERQAILQVLVVSIVFLVTNMPHMIYLFIEFAIPNQFGIYRQYHFAYITYYSVRLNFEQFNSAVNILIYYKYNTKFRERCFKKKV